MKQTFNLIATAAAGLEAVVGSEVRELGYDCQVENGRVRFGGDVKAIIETNLWLRAADRIKIIVGTFPAKTFEELFQGVFALDWENYLPLGARFPISKAKERRKPGAILRAIIAASIQKVPEPQVGSISGLSGYQFDNCKIAAAMFSLIGAPPFSVR